MQESNRKLPKKEVETLTKLEKSASHIVQRNRGRFLPITAMLESNLKNRKASLSNMEDERMNNLINKYMKIKKTKASREIIWSETSMTHKRTNQARHNTVEFNLKQLAKIKSVKARRSLSIELEKHQGSAFYMLKKERNAELRSARHNMQLLRHYERWKTIVREAEKIDLLDADSKKVVRDQREAFLKYKRRLQSEYIRSQRRIIRDAPNPVSTRPSYCMLSNLPYVESTGNASAFL
eukprot:TRINITY_DN5779_c0_g1_i4.p1 TRINITY_DN5779_c0_g1~~TRINITY_DN5779_c0_g1_i4.p1  ORF type:complete len:237 (-),score=57.87 TRINITY_DN5779_c0_g1_i4:109-819(-)